MMHRSQNRRALVVGWLALALVGTVLTGTTIRAGLQAVADSATVAWWTRLPGGRALWLSKRPGCSPTVAPLPCRLAGLAPDAQLSIIYYPPMDDPMEYTIWVPRGS